MSDGILAAQNILAQAGIIYNRLLSYRINTLFSMPGI